MQTLDGLDELDQKVARRRDVLESYPPGPRSALLLERDTLQLRPEGHSERSESLFNLAVSLRTRFRQRGSIDDLEESISLYRDSLVLRPPGHPGRSKSQGNLGNALRARFEQSGAIDDLEESFSLYRDSLVLHPPGHPDRSMSQMNLGTALKARFEQSGAIDDLEESISLYRDSLVLRPPGHPGRSMSQMNLGTALQRRFEQSGAIGDLEESISLYRDSLVLRPLGHPSRSAAQMNLGNALQTRFRQSGAIDDLEESISLYRDSLVLRPPGHPDRSMSQMNLGNALKARFAQSGAIDDLEESISLYRDSLILHHPGHPLRASSQFNLGRALETRFKQTHLAENLEEAIGVLKDCANGEFSSLLDRLDAAKRWAVVAREHVHPSGLSAYESAVNLLEASLNVAPTLHMQHELLTGKRGYPTLVVDAASFAIKKGRLGRAIEFLEQGRALLWSQMRGFRVTMDDLAIVDKHLANKLKEVNDKMEALSTSTSSKTDNSTSDASNRLPSGTQKLDDMMMQCRRLSEQRKEIISRIRLIPGFEDFQRPTPFAKLQKAAAEGPVIAVNHSEYRSDALIVLYDTDPILLPLSEDCPGFYDDMTELHQNLADARRRSLSALPQSYTKTLRFALMELWKLVVSKVVRKLTEIGIQKGSRIWWCPTSVLSSLPLHAAGVWNKDDDGITRYHPYDYKSSYTPSLNALIQARSGSDLNSSSNGVSSILFVGQEDDSLQRTGQERDEIESLVDVVWPLVGEQATPAEVLERLKDHPWAHFACHGMLEPRKPFDSSFRLSNDGLKLLDIVRARLPKADFAFLAACHTAEQTEGSAHDEVLHLAAGMQFCGFRSAIGTMWAMRDDVGPAFAKAFYTHMLAEDGTSEKGFKRSAYALHAAATELRSRKENRLSLESWVNLVHIGA